MERQRPAQQPARSPRWLSMSEHEALDPFPLCCLFKPRCLFNFRPLKSQRLTRRLGRRGRRQGCGAWAGQEKVPSRQEAAAAGSRRSGGSFLPRLPRFMIRSSLPFPIHLSILLSPTGGCGQVISARCGLRVGRGAGARSLGCPLGQVETRPMRPNRVDQPACCQEEHDCRRATISKAAAGPAHPPPPNCPHTGGRRPSPPWPPCHRAGRQVDPT